MMAPTLGMLSLMGWQPFAHLNAISINLRSCCVSMRPSPIVVLLVLRGAFGTRVD
jgi:hypothetical protein